jgi:lysine/ornithine N-monooxygenase
MKVCKKCKEEKELSEYYKHSKMKDGYFSSCKICDIKATKNNQLNNKKRFEEYQKKYYLNNIERKKEYLKSYSKVYSVINKDKISKSNKDYYLKNKLKITTRNNNNKKIRRLEPLFKLKETISSLIRISIKKRGYTKDSRSYEILGCSYEEFKIHLQRQFVKGMNWQNQGEWHLDHIYPTSLAKNEEELIRLNHYTNFQPLWAIDNIKKGNKIIEKQLILI